jgi:hypothetical protein
LRCGEPSTARFFVTVLVRVFVKSVIANKSCVTRSGFGAYYETT